MDRDLTTWHGVADLRTLSVQEMKDDVIDPSPQDGPIDLLAAAFNVTTVSIDTEEIHTKMVNALLKLALSSLVTSSSRFVPTSPVNLSLSSSVSSKLLLIPMDRLRVSQ